MATHTHTSTWSNGSGAPVTATVSKTAGLELNINESIDASATNQLFTIGFAFAKLKMVYLKSDVDLVIKTNSSTEPDDTINLEAGQELFWHEDMEAACPFTADVTAFYITEANATAALLQGGILTDPT